MIADVSPLAIAIARNAPLMPSRFGRPKLTFEAPHVVFTPSSSRSRPRSRKTWRPAVRIAPIGMTQRVDDDVLARDAVVERRARRSCFATANRTSGSSEMPVSSLRDRDDGRAVPADQRQDPLQALVLAGHGVHQRLALVDGEAGLERLDDRRVDRQGQVRQRLDQLDGAGQDRRLVGQRDPGVDVEHVGAGLDLGE